MEDALKLSNAEVDCFVKNASMVRAIGGWVNQDTHCVEIPEIIVNSFENKIDGNGNLSKIELYHAMIGIVYVYDTRMIYLCEALGKDSIFTKKYIDCRDKLHELAKTIQDNELCASSMVLNYRRLLRTLNKAIIDNNPEFEFESSTGGFELKKVECNNCRCKEINQRLAQQNIEKDNDVFDFLNYDMSIAIDTLSKELNKESKGSFGKTLVNAEITSIGRDLSPKQVFHKMKMLPVLTDIQHTKKGTLDSAMSFLITTEMTDIIEDKVKEDLDKFIQGIPTGVQVETPKSMTKLSSDYFDQPTYDSIELVKKMYVIMVIMSNYSEKLVTDSKDKELIQLYAMFKGNSLARMCKRKTKKKQKKKRHLVTIMEDVIYNNILWGTAIAQLIYQKRKIINKRFLTCTGRNIAGWKAYGISLG